MISAVVLTKNEEKNIKECLETIKWCDEVIVVDDYSADKTVEIAKKLGAKVFKHSLNNDFARQRNYGLDKAKGDWVLFVDADERVTDAFQFEINCLTIDRDRRQQLNGFFVKRQDIVWGKKLRHGETGNIKLLRLAKKDAGRWQGRVHEEWRIKGKIAQFKNALIHYPHQGVADFLEEINFYTTLRTKELRDKKVKASCIGIVFYPLGKFLLNYFVRKGFLDGIPGLVFAIIMSFHSFLVRAKLWLLWQ